MALQRFGVQLGADGLCREPQGTALGARCRHSLGCAALSSCCCLSCPAAVGSLLAPAPLHATGVRLPKGVFLFFYLYYFNRVPNQVTRV